MTASEQGPDTLSPPNTSPFALAAPSLSASSASLHEGQKGFEPSASISLGHLKNVNDHVDHPQAISHPELMSASSLSALSPFANAPPLASTLSTTLSTVSGHDISGKSPTPSPDGESLPTPSSRLQSLRSRSSSLPSPFLAAASDFYRPSGPLETVEEVSKEYYRSSEGAQTPPRGSFEALRGAQQPPAWPPPAPQPPSTPEKAVQSNTSLPRCTSEPTKFGTNSSFSHPSGIPRPQLSQGAVPGIGAAKRALFPQHGAEPSITQPNWGPSIAQLQAAALQAMQYSPLVTTPAAAMPTAAVVTPLFAPASLSTAAQRLQHNQSFTSPGLNYSTPLPVAPTTAQDVVGLQAFAQAQQGLAADYNLTPRQSFDAVSPSVLSSQPSNGAAMLAEVMNNLQMPGGSVRKSLDDSLGLPFAAARYSISLDSLRENAPGDWSRSSAGESGEERGPGEEYDSAASMLERLQLSTEHLPKVRALLHSCGKFKTLSSKMHYEGGRLRLVSLPEGCTFAELIAVLAKIDNPSPNQQTPLRPGRKDTSNSTAAVAAPGSISVHLPHGATSPNFTGSAPPTDYIDPSFAAQVIRSQCILRYQLPSDPSIFVDVIGDEDVKLMFEEYADMRQHLGATAPKPKLFLQWTGAAGGGGCEPHSSAGLESVILKVRPSNEFMYPSYSAMRRSTSSSSGEEGLGSGGGSRNPSINLGLTASIDPFTRSLSESVGPLHSQLNLQSLSMHAAHRSANDLRLTAVRSDQLECIQASEVTLLEFLGSGTFGDMYRGVWKDCNVGVKCLNAAHAGLNSSQAAWLAFLDDANSSAALRHPNLVEVYGIVLPGEQAEVVQQAQQHSYPWNGPSGSSLQDQKMGGRRTSWDFSKGQLSSSSGQFCVRSSAGAVQRLPGPVACPPAVVMEYVSGRSLRRAIDRKDDAVAGALARIIYALDTARAMAYLHARGVPHFDLKSSNVLLGWRNLRPAAKIAGYGLSARQAAMKSYTPGVTMSPGIFPWTAPEVLRNPDTVSHKADIYSFSMIMYELWALREPYDQKELTSLISLVVNTDEEVRPKMPPPGNAEEPGPEWSALMQRCWAESPEERPEFVEIEKELRVMAKAVKDAQKKKAPATSQPAAAAC